ncbi:MAG: prepilin-type N-terminal cleavage/methylation domain-containing protein, partial [Fidelibacterota bacterium]
MKPYRFFRSRAGFTMIELIIAVIVFAIVSTVLAVTIASSVKILGAAKNREQIALDGEVAVTQFVRDFKMLNDNTSIQETQKTQIKFDMKRGKTLDYKLINGQLQVKEGNGSFEVLVDSVNMDSSYFAYWDSNGTALTSFPLSKNKRESIWRVQLTLDLKY